MNTINNQLTDLLQQIGVQREPAQHILVIAAIIIVACIADCLCRRIIVPIIQKLRAKTPTQWDDYLLNDAVLNDACHLIPPIVLYVLLPFAFPEEPAILSFILKLCGVYIIIGMIKLVYAFVNSLHAISYEHKKLKNHSMKGVFQMIKLIVVCVGIILIIAILADKDPLKILTGLGASAAILMLVFKDTIMGLVAGVQLTANNMLRPGDWIKMPKNDLDGIVTEVTLTTIKVLNWDNSVSTIPPYALVSDTFQNWRPMSESEGRRVKRAICIDMNTVRFCTAEEMEAFAKRGWLEGLETGKEVVNLYVFRHYLENYLRHHPGVNADLLLMVRQLEPTPQGLPLELYFFSANKDWIPYERLQAEVFDYLLAVLPAFGLRIFQRPAGTDILSLGKSE